tara:strand:+ start:299 stop:547 length:249 start_codon:yes stop_codon:yes gene_type:complete
MKFKPGDLVRIKPEFDEDLLCMPLGIILKGYANEPIVFKKDYIENKRWMAQEPFRSPYVYDIIIQGEVELCISEDWIRMHPE